MITLGIITITVFSLTACSTNNSDSAKESFIADTVTLNNLKDYNSQNIRIDINELKLQGEDTSRFNNFLFKDAHLNLNIGVDRTDQPANLVSKVTFDKKIIL